MRRSIVFAALAGAMVISSVASAAEVRFRGAFTITSVQNCLARYIGETFNSTFLPANIGDNPNASSLSELNQYSGDVYVATGAAFTTGKWIALSANGFDNFPYAFNARIFLSLISPIGLNPNTPFVSLVGKIDNMGNDPGVDGKKCLVGFRGSYFRRIEQP
jgi:hypothetical protein